jgi:hypothetical protein
MSLLYAEEDGGAIMFLNFIAGVSGSKTARKATVINMM